MYSTLVTMIFSLLILMGGEISVARGQPGRKNHEWYRPDSTKMGRVCYHPDRMMKVVAGDTLSEKVQPYFTLEKWGDLDSPATPSAWFRIRQFNTDPDSNRIGGDSVIIYNGYQEQAIYTLDDGLEWTIFLRQKPVSNVLSYQIFTSNLEFLYQPKWVETDSVKGSYAVYHATKANNKYKTGKVFHIYRPKAWDANGDTVWCDLNIDTVNGTLSIALPPDFWNNAVYPVIVDPTFGYDEIGGNSITFATGWARGNRYDTDQYTASSGDVVDSLYFYGKSNASGGDLIIGVYTTSGDVPNLRTGYSAWIVSPTSYQWIGSNVNISLTNGTEYTLAMNCQDENHNTYADVLVDGYSYESSPILPTTWSEGGTLGYRISMYAVYTTAGGGVTPSPRRRKIPKVFGGIDEEIDNTLMSAMVK